MNLSPRMQYFVETIMEWAVKNIRRFPWRNRITPKRILIAEILLQRTPANRVAERYQEIIDLFDQDMTMIDDSTLITQFKSFGLTKRFVWIRNALKQIDEKHSGKVPKSYEELIDLPGVGEYTANAILCLAYDFTVPMTDTNVIRVLSRFFYGQNHQSGKSDSELKELATLLVPNDNPKTYNLGLLDFGAMVCKKNPLCTDCIFSITCKKKIEVSPSLILCDKWRCKQKDLVLGTQSIANLVKFHSF